MARKWLGAWKIRQLSTDVKPAKCYRGYKIEEEDTGKEFEYDGTQWNEKSGGSLIVGDTISFPYTTVDSDYVKEGNISFNTFEANDNESAPIGPVGCSPTYASGPTRVSSWNKTCYLYVNDVFVKNLNLSFSANVNYNRTYANITSLIAEFTDGTTQSLTNNATTLLNKQLYRINVTINGGYSRNGPQMNFTSSTTYTSGNGIADIQNENECGTDERINPSIENSFGAGLVGAIDFPDGPLNRTTSTEFKIEAEVGGVWVKLRTVTSLGKIRFNLVSTNKIKVTGIDATAKRISIDKFRILKVTTNDVYSHGHVEIDPESNSLGLDGL